jgi:guanylate kinase
MTQTPDHSVNEDQILEYIDVLERTASTSMAMLKHIDDKESQQMLARDVEVLMDLRVRIWKQFTPVLVDVVN